MSALTGASWEGRESVDYYRSSLALAPGRSAPRAPSTLSVRLCKREKYKDVGKKGAPGEVGRKHWKLSLVSGGERLRRDERTDSESRLQWDASPDR